MRVQQKEREGGYFQHITPLAVVVVWLSDLLTISGCTLSGWTTRGGKAQQRQKGQDEAGQYEWLRVRGSVSLGSLMMTYLLEQSVSSIAHYLGSNWKINRLLSQRPHIAMALRDWQLKPKVIPADRERWGSTPGRRERRGRTWRGFLSQQFDTLRGSLTTWVQSLRNTRAVFLD